MFAWTQDNMADRFLYKETSENGTQTILHWELRNEVYSTAMAEASVPRARAHTHTQLITESIRV
jgi:hypothetical protein